MELKKILNSSDKREDPEAGLKRWGTPIHHEKKK